jgi:hypothetical protein
VSVPEAVEPKKSRGGMASLAADLTSRAGSLAHRSTDEKLVPEPKDDGDSNRPAADASRDDRNNVLQGEAASAEGGDTKITQPRLRQSTVSGRRSLGPVAARRPAQPLAGPEGRLEASGEAVVKMTLELAPQLIMALNIWERDETKRLGQRVFRERMIDLALDGLPVDVDSILDLVAVLPPALRHAPGQQFGTRVRGSVRDKLLSLRPELRVAGVKNVRIRDVYSAGVYRYLIGLGISIEDPEAAASN